MTLAKERQISGAFPLYRDNDAHFFVFALTTMSYPDFPHHLISAELPRASYAVCQVQSVTNSLPRPP